jgi:hypothetical protein
MVPVRATTMFNENLRFGLIAKLRQPLSLGIEHFIYHRADFWQSADGAREWIKRHRVINGFPLTGESRFDDELLHIDIRAIEGGQLGRQQTNGCRLDAVPINQARHFHAASIRQIVNQAAIGHIAVDARQTIGLYRFNDV